MKSHRPTHQSALVHLAAGGVGGTAGAIVTCPLEVIKTRLQSSIPVFRPAVAYFPGNVTFSFAMEKVPVGILACTKHIIKTEGMKSLFRGLGPNLVGVAPSRAIYFTAYAKTKSLLNNSGLVKRDSSYVHMLSGLSAGVTSTTATSPIWVVKTRLQLDSSVVNRFGILDSIKEIYSKDGLRGFYRGLSASYFGVTETVIHLVIYEHIKAKINGMRGINKDYGKKPRVENFIEYMFAAGMSKSIACTLTYPHEVVRTRLRQYELDGQRKYHSFLQTLIKVGAEEGASGLYRGLTTQLFRQIPNTGIIFLTYEIILSCFES
ncbi:solute carrier family 25 member 36-A-like [Paramuricea clavata]|nr:solute carrier family 25 member 36-A-like [Paramuricea clavata]